MRFLIIVKATPNSESGAIPEDKLMEEMADYHEELARAGILRHEPSLQANTCCLASVAMRGQDAVHSEAT